MDLSPDEDNFPGRLLHQAALWDNAELLEDLLRGTERRALDAADARGRTALHAAAVAERSRCLRALLDAGARVDARSDDATGGRTALHIAAERGHSENIKALIARGASTAARDAGGSTPLELAERAGQRHAAVVLREARDASERARAARHAALRESVQAGDVAGLRAALAALGGEAGLVVNLTPGGANTLLYVASEMGLADAVAALLEAGADGRAHPVTRYSPLYIAGYHGHVAIVHALLAHFPELVQRETVERWVPLHAACIGGHAAVVTLLLNFKYPEKLLNTYVDPTGVWQYRAALDVNHMDVGGQTPLYVACTLGNLPIVELLLGYTVAATKIQSPQEPEDTPVQLVPDTGSPPVDCRSPVSADESREERLLSPTRRRISDGIQSIMSRLTGQTSGEQSTPLDTSNPTASRVRAASADGGCPGDCALGAAVRGRHPKVVEVLLRAGAQPNVPCRSSDEPYTSTPVSRNSRTRSSSAYPRRASPSPSPCRGTRSSSAASSVYGDGTVPSVLALAMLARDDRLAELLLAHGAADAGDYALLEAARQGDEIMLARLLAIKAYSDPEFKINKRAMTEMVSALGSSGSRAPDAGALTYSAIFPSQPVMVNWRELTLNAVKMSWLRSAVLQVNPRLSATRTALHALTRIDLSFNRLQHLPVALFTLTSLRYLNVAQNKLERLPGPGDSADEALQDQNLADRDRPGRGPRVRLLPLKMRGREGDGRKNSENIKNGVYTAPVLEEIYLQHNRLEELPACLFGLPALTTLDVSNNKLATLPAAMWHSPRLRDLNAAFNSLKDLPRREHEKCDGLTHSSTPPSPSEGCPGDQPRLASSCSASHISQLIFGLQQMKTASRSPSIDRGVNTHVSDERTEQAHEDEKARPPTIETRTTHATPSELRKQHLWQRSLEVTEEVGGAVPTAPGSGSRLASINLAHNQYTSVPTGLACLAPNLARLNMAHNFLRSMSYVTSYPNGLRQLDLSHNRITLWPSLPQVSGPGDAELPHVECQCAAPAGARRPRSGCSLRCAVLSAVCAARRHLRLEGLRTLILANNLLDRIQLTTDDDGVSVSSSLDSGNTDEEDEWNVLPPVKTRLLFPNLSMLDISNNCLRAVPPAIHDLTNLSVLNVSGNTNITELPPQMGLLSRLWNLNTSGCPLAEPLRSMIDSKKYKTMDLVGYLKSVLEDAQPYARMKLMVVGVQGIGKTSLLECLRQESAPAYRRKPSEHWAKRMGNKGAGKTSRGANVSTVGVDIGVWTYEKQRGARGPVTFRTWDFGGQQEYYATHQYFLSRRSLYVCAWRATDGRRGLAGAVRWLRSVQARAPGCSVILVATHYDQVHNMTLPYGDTPESLQRMIRCRLMGVADADKLGLPRVLDTLEVSCRTRHNVRLLADIIYDAAYSMRPPGSKEPLLEQRVPATYLALEECVASMCQEFKAQGRDPVLRQDQYRQQVTQYMQQKFHRSFRDLAELHQATMFLHENGVLLHYDDATLKELYFLDPQWLCDMLAHVVTVREINPFARSGIMKVDDLQHLFRASVLGGRSEEARSLTVALLNKFELALGWDGRMLLVPPLLPAAANAVKLPLRSRHWPSAVSGQRVWVSPLAVSLPADSASSSRSDSPKLIAGVASPTAWGRSSPERALRRLLVLSYVPAGFWPRLITRVLADEAVGDVLQAFYQLPHELAGDSGVVRASRPGGAWQLWRCGLRLVAGELALLSVQELPGAASEDPLCGACDEEGDGGWWRNDDYSGMRFKLKQEGVWCDLELQNSSLVEIYLPSEVMVIKRPIVDESGDTMGYQNISVEPNPEALSRLLALASDHVDLLLEDWYPTLGTRFVHTSEGRCLITRIVPCPQCVSACGAGPGEAPAASHDTVSAAAHDHSAEQNDAVAELQAHLDVAFRRAEGRRVRGSQESHASDGDSGVDAESSASSRMPSVEGVLVSSAAQARSTAYAWSIEESILAACGGGARALCCPAHGNVLLADVAPDTIFLDVGEQRVARGDELARGRLLGRGAFGLVFRATWRRRGSGAREVALKVLQPVAPGPRARASDVAAYKAAASRWAREPQAAACRAYCGARQELAVLAPLRHAHVVPLLAVCAAPLALLLELAPMGALDALLRSYRSCGQRVGVRAAAALALQVARALEYLHARRIVYRDLKAENVLVWKAPQAHDAQLAEANAEPINVLVKLADYGISRLTLPSGTKGFGGTEGFMAPEIMKYNGEEEYTEKVDCFSYGMFLYEVLTLRQPFEGHEAVKEAILEGGRPPLTPKDTLYPCYMLDAMSACWCGAPEWRPSASRLVSLAAAPEFPRLQDVATTSAVCTAAAVAVQARNVTEEGTAGWEVWWWSQGAGKSRLHLFQATPDGWHQHHTVKMQGAEQESEDSFTVTAMCWTGKSVWIGDSRGHITVFAVRDCSVSWSRRMEDAVGGGSLRAGVAALLALAALARVAVAMNNGRLFLVSMEEPEAEGSFIQTELGSASVLHCLAGVQFQQRWEVWCGGGAGRVWVYAADASGVLEARELTHETVPCADVTKIAALGLNVYTYLEPGCVVYQWNAESKSVTGRLDCSKLVPCSESLKSISIEEHLSPGRCQVTALSVLGSEVYIGTAWGCVIVAEARSLRPITVFRPYEEEVLAMVALPSHEGAPATPRMVATLGRGYRSLMARYTDTPNHGSGSSSTSHLSNGTYCLLWRAEHWASD